MQTQRVLFVVLLLASGRAFASDLCTHGDLLSIPALQGAGDVSPRQGEAVVIRGVVTGDFQGRDELEGFFLQDPEGDGDPATSDGVFVHAPGARDVRPGDGVVARGTVAEFHGLTELAEVTEVAVCGDGVRLPPLALSWPLPPGIALERYEGMLLRFSEPLTVVDTHDLGRYGKIRVGAGRPFQASVAGGALAPPAFLVVDDGRNDEDPRPVPYLDRAGTLRLGATVTGLTGVLTFAHRDYALHPTRPIELAPANPRPASPPTVGGGGGTLRVASFNVLAYFTTLGERGASSLEELKRQRDKLVAALLAMDADIVGLIELENNGATAVSDLVAALNARAGGDVYAFVADPPGGMGDDAIKVGLLYKSARVQPSGPPLTDRDPAFKRPPLGQTFAVGGEAVSVVVAHFKSKGSCDEASGDERDHGQGCWNATRVRQASRLLDFVRSVASTSGDPDVLVVGDLNAYGGEDPIRTLVNGGLVDQTAAHVPAAERYSFVYRGVAGHLDHALTTPELAPRTLGVAFWHVNADEPTLLDYDTEHNPPELYHPDPFRSSDHDPLLVGLDL